MSTSCLRFIKYCEVNVICITLVVVVVVTGVTTGDSCGIVIVLNLL